MPKFDVIVMRPVTLLENYEGFSTMQDLQYIAKNVSAASYKDAGTIAIAEVREADVGLYPKCSASQYEVLGTFLQGKYKPWFNGSYP